MQKWIERVEWAEWAESAVRIVGIALSAVLLLISAFSFFAIQGLSSTAAWEVALFVGALLLIFVSSSLLLACFIFRTLFLIVALMSLATIALLVTIAIAISAEVFRGDLTLPLALMVPHAVFFVWLPLRPDKVLKPKSASAE